MNFNITSYTSFSFVMVLFFPSLIFAPWTEQNRPKSLPETIKIPCHNWIIYSGFTATNYSENVKQTKLREVKFDKDASMFAAMYAIKIGGKSPPPEILPEIFCEEIGSDQFVYSFTALKAQLKTCPSWISYYGYSEYNIDHNILHAYNQVEEEMDEISIWAYSYYKYLIKYGANFPLIPLEFCHKMEVYIAKYREFINTHEPQLTCKAWIELYGYTDDVYGNRQKAMRLIEFYTRIRIHDFVRDYAKRIRLLGVDVGQYDYTPLKTPLMYCREFVNTANQVEDTETYSFDYTFSSFPENA